MRSTLKNLLLLYLSKRAAVNPTTDRSIRVLVVGDLYRPFITQEVARLLAPNSKVIVNRPGYNYRLGLVLTLMGIPAGISNPFSWFKRVGEAHKDTTVVYRIQEFAVIDPAADARFISQVLCPDVVVVVQIENALSNELKIFLDHCNFEKIAIAKELQGYADLQIGMEKGATYEILQLQEGEKGTDVVCLHDGTSQEFYLNSFGVHYVFAKLLAEYLRGYAKKT